jgi:hypothetical protein
MWTRDSSPLQPGGDNRTAVLVRSVEHAFDGECWRWSRIDAAKAAVSGAVRGAAPAWTLLYEGEHADLSCRVALEGALLAIEAAAPLQRAPPAMLLASLQRRASDIGFVWDGRRRALTSHIEAPALDEAAALLPALHRCARALDLALPVARAAIARPPLRLAAVFVRS